MILLTGILCFIGGYVAHVVKTMSPEQRKEDSWFAWVLLTILICTVVTMQKQFG